MRPAASSPNHSGAAGIPPQHVTRRHTNTYVRVCSVAFPWQDRGKPRGSPAVRLALFPRPVEVHVPSGGISARVGIGHVDQLPLTETIIVPHCGDLFAFRQ